MKPSKFVLFAFIMVAVAGVSMAQIAGNRHTQPQASSTATSQQQNHAISNVQSSMAQHLCRQGMTWLDHGPYVSSPGACVPQYVADTTEHGCSHGTYWGPPPPPMTSGGYACYGCSGMGGLQHPAVCNAP
jgi:hypothetical protein